MKPSSSYQFTLVSMRYCSHRDPAVPSYYVKTLLPADCIRRERRRQWFQRAYYAEKRLLPRGKHTVLDWYISSSDVSLFQKDDVFYPFMIIFIGYEKNYWAFANTSAFVEGTCPPVPHCSNCVNGLFRVLSACKGDYFEKTCSDTCSGHDHSPHSHTPTMLEVEGDR